ncbi:hypothetical protein ACIQ9M_28695 [Streptomyces californicus]|uniref:hypothetical protein n=1 Tax=Streptomyces TaxID=1883 RepID=UPI0005B9BC3F|nr:hypothetical protein [Streptomyces vinaceus]MDP9947790.1 hypothetical protein [Streptomyces sp. DSM 41269]
MGKGERSVSKARRSPALTAFGRAIPQNLVDMDEQSADYTPDSDGPQSKPPEPAGASRTSTAETTTAHWPS